MSRHESILAGVCAAMLLMAASFWGYQGHLCKIEAIKAGMKGDEVVKACR
jgi:hypothetical protein